MQKINTIPQQYGRQLPTVPYDLVYVRYDGYGKLGTTVPPVSGTSSAAVPYGALHINFFVIIIIISILLYLTLPHLATLTMNFYVPISSTVGRVRCNQWYRTGVRYSKVPYLQWTAYWAVYVPVPGGVPVPNITFIIGIDFKAAIFHVTAPI